MARNRAASWVLLMAVSALLLGAVSAGLELVFRRVGIPYRVTWTPSETRLAQFDEDVGWSYLPNRSTTMPIGDTTWVIHTDGRGIRVPSQGYQLSPTQPSILFVGDSFTVGHGLPFEEGFVGQMGTMLADRYQVVNLGVQGYGTDQAYLALRRHLREFNTRAVVYTFIYLHIQRNGNYDRRMLVPTGRYIGTKPLLAVAKDGSVEVVKRPVVFGNYRHSLLFDFLTMRLGSLVGTFPPFPERLTARIIESMREVCREAGAEFVVVNWRWRPADYDALFRDLDAHVVDTLEGAPDGWPKMIIPGDNHPNADAHGHVARLLMRHFCRLGLVECERDDSVGSKATESGSAETGSPTMGGRRPADAGLPCAPVSSRAMVCSFA